MGVNTGNEDLPCVEVQKVRAVKDGELVFDRWCYVHGHWLNDAPPQLTVADKMIDDLECLQETEDEC